MASGQSPPINGRVVRNKIVRQPARRLKIALPMQWTIRCMQIFAVALKSMAILCMRCKTIILPFALAIVYPYDSCIIMSDIWNSCGMVGRTSKTETHRQTTPKFGRRWVSGYWVVCPNMDVYTVQSKATLLGQNAVHGHKKARTPYLSPPSDENEYFPSFSEPLNDLEITRVCIHMRSDQKRNNMSGYGGKRTRSRRTKEKCLVFFALYGSQSFCSRFFPEYRRNHIQSYSGKVEFKCVLLATGLSIRAMGSVAHANASCSLPRSNFYYVYADVSFAFISSLLLFPAWFRSRSSFTSCSLSFSFVFFLFSSQWELCIFIRIIGSNRSSRYFGYISSVTHIFRGIEC